MSPIKYVAFLRGINSGKNPPVKMQVLRELFETLGFDNIWTVGASGNVIFETNIADKNTLELRIEKALPEAIGFESPVVLCDIDSLKNLFLSNPFRDIEATSKTKFYVTFIKQDSMAVHEYPLDGKGYTILGVFGGIVCSVVDLQVGRTPELMRALDKEFRSTTTRNWTTIERIVQKS